MRWRKQGKAASEAVLLVVLALAPLYVSPFNLSLLGRFLALAILSLGLALVWGWGGMLSLGQGVFWGLGAYALAMHLKLVGLAPGDLPDFMQWSGLSALPAWWIPFRHAWFAFAAVIAVPALAAAVLAWLVLARRVGGVFFALITQALALAFATLLVSEQAYSGGFNGLTDYGTLLGHTLASLPVQRAIYWITLALLAASLLFCRWLLHTNFGRILLAIRDGENRVRFLGYNPTGYKVVAFAIGGALAGLSGALFILPAGVISPAMVGVVPSIEMLIAVAVGGRTSLMGVVLGTLLVNFGKDWISSAMPELWLLVMGGLLILVIMALPEGLAGVPALLGRALARRRRSRRELMPALAGEEEG